jgi:hypothetical protein
MVYVSKYMVLCPTKWFTPEENSDLLAVSVIAVINPWPANFILL